MLGKENLEDEDFEIFELVCSFSFSLIGMKHLKCMFEFR